MRTLVSDDGLLLSDLWIDQPDALQELRNRAQTANIDEDCTRAAADVITKGFGVIDLDLRPSVFGEIDQQLGRIWDERPADVAYGGTVGEMTGDFSLRDVPASYTRSDPPLYRLCCAHTHSPGLEEVFFNKKLHQEISFLFGEPAIAVQTLYFEYGSRQGQHRDTSVVSFNPLSNLLAAWVALEDIQEGTGELEYFPGSHRVENFFYPDGSIVWRDEYGPGSFERMDQGIRSTAAKHNLQPERFLARRSQALIWHHSLSHGGGPVTKPDLTRKSLVIHFTTLSNFTRRYHQLIFKDETTGDFRSFIESSPEVIERDGCYASASIIAGWRDRPLPPSKRLRSFTTEDLSSFRGHETGGFKNVDHLVGWVDSIVPQEDHGSVAIFGWAINEATKSPAARIAAVAGAEPLAVWPTSVIRPDIAELYGSMDACYAGFYAVLPKEKFEGRTDIKFFAVEDDGSFNEIKCSDAALEFLDPLARAVRSDQGPVAGVAP